MNSSETDQPSTVWSFVLHVLIASVGLLGTFANVYTFYVLTRIRIESRLTAVLFKSQCLIDCFTCTAAVLYRALPRAINSGWWLTDIVFCHIWYADNIFWLGSVASVHCLLCLSVDRFVAVVTPLFYRTHKRCLITACLVYVACFPTLIFIPNCLLRVYQDGRCQFGYFITSDVMSTFFNYEGYSWIVTTFLAPAAFMITSHAIICYVIWKNNRDTFPADSREQKKARNCVVRNKLRRVAFTTTLMVLNLSVCRAYDTIYFLLSHINSVVYESGSLKQLVGILLGTTGSLLNPVILILTGRSISDFMRRQLALLTHRETGKCRCTPSG